MSKWRISKNNENLPLQRTLNLLRDSRSSLKLLIFMALKFHKNASPSCLDGKRVKNLPERQENAGKASISRIYGNSTDNPSTKRKIIGKIRNIPGKDFETFEKHVMNLRRRIIQHKIDKIHPKTFPTTEFKLEKFKISGKIINFHFSNFLKVNFPLIIDCTSETQSISQFCPDAELSERKPAKYI